MFYLNYLSKTLFFKCYSYFNILTCYGGRVSIKKIDIGGIMGFNYMEKFLLSDLLLQYSLTKDKIYYEEIKNRMLFCGFTIEEVSEFINFEGKILKQRKHVDNKLILDKKYIVGKKQETKIFDNIENYMYDPDKNNENTLMISETIAIIDEAIFLSYSNAINEYAAKKEILNLTKENETNWLYFEFKNRIEYICRCANKIIDGPKYALYNEKNSNLYNNEMQICIMRWNVDVSSKNFIPYTNQYYD